MITMNIEQVRKACLAMHSKVEDATVRALIAESFRLVIDKLPKKIQKELFETI